MGRPQNRIFIKGSFVIKTKSFLSGPKNWSNGKNVYLKVDLLYISIVEFGLLHKKTVINFFVCKICIHTYVKMLRLSFF